jgi:DNA-binding CsgD family transcriptional regulator
MTLDVAIEALWLVQAGRQFLPATCIIGKGRSGADLFAEPLRPRASDIFTARQATVVKALCQGKANKIITCELKMKESTVKVHVRNIMKKLEEPDLDRLHHEPTNSSPTGRKSEATGRLALSTRVRWITRSISPRARLGTRFEN